MAKPLAGKRIVVTRNQQQAERMCQQLAALGADPIRLPVLAFTPLPVPPLDVAAYDWLLFTSANGVRFFAERLHDSSWATEPLRRFFSGDNEPNFPRVGAVGEVTAHLLKRRGIEVAFIPEVFTGEQLALGLGDVRGKRVLLPRSQSGRPEILSLLRQQGAWVDDVALYETITAVPPAESLAELAKGVDVITFVSPSSVENFLALAQPDAAALIACIGPATATTAQEHGLTVAIMPEVHTVAALVTAVADYFHQKEPSHE